MNTPEALSAGPDIGVEPDDDGVFRLPALADEDALFPITQTVVLSAHGELELDQQFLAPVRRLNNTLADVLDIDAHPHRTPDEAMTLLREAMDAFNRETGNWTPTRPEPCDPPVTDATPERLPAGEISR